MKRTTDKKISLEKISEYLPSKKVFYIMVATVFLIIMIYIVSGIAKTTYTSQNAEVITVGDAINIDSDNDGVADWEELLWGTDPSNPDSDEDGVPDSTEISDRKEALAGSTASSTGALSETDKFSRDLFVTYSALSQQGELTDQAGTRLSQVAINKSIENLPVIRTYSKIDFKVVPTTIANNTEYKVAVTKLSQVGGGKLGTEFTQINSAVQNDEIDQLRTAAKNSTVYNQYLNSLLKLSVPSIQAENHVRLLNNLSYIAGTLPQIETLEEDVIKGYPLYTIYVQAYQDMFQTFEAIGAIKVK